MLSPWKKRYDKPRLRIKNQRHYFASRGPYCQSYGFSGSHIWMWELDHKEGWALKTWCFWIVVLEKTLESPLDCKESKLVNIKEINPEYSFEGLMLKLKFKYLCHLMWRTDSFEKTLMKERLKAGEGDDSAWDSWTASPTQWIWIWVNSGRWWRTGKPGVLQSMGSQRVGHGWVTEQQQHCWYKRYFRRFSLREETH